ncbi:MAG: hypothetical protein P4M02_04525, partial [Clostridia bacterium]|nr:hypothetical protein [Clostridia bacterium]
MTSAAQENGGFPGIPGWLLEEDGGGAAKPSRTKTHFIAKTLAHISEVFENDLLCERYAGMPMFLQSIDARVKLLTFVFYIVFSNFISNPAVLVILAAAPLAFARLSGLDTRSFARRVWLYLPLLVLLFSLPGAT